MPSAAASLADSTLIMTDCQNTYTQGVMELTGVQAALDEAAVLLDRARSAARGEASAGTRSASARSSAAVAFAAAIQVIGSPALVSADPEDPAGVVQARALAVVHRGQLRDLLARPGVPVAAGAAALDVVDRVLHRLGDRGGRQVGGT